MLGTGALGFPAARPAAGVTLQTNVKRKLAIGTTALAAAAFAGGAYAATQEPGAGTRQAFLNDVAKRLNVSPAQLSAAIRGAYDDQLQAEVAAGKLTQSQANAIKQRLRTGGKLPLGPLWFRHGPPGGPRPGAGPGQLPAAAAYLGLSERQLIDQLAAGKTLSQLAKARGKSVSGLEAALSSALRSQLQKAVSDKRISSAQEQQILSRLTQRIDQEINRTWLRPGNRMRPLFPGPHGPNGPRAQPGSFAPSSPPPAPSGPAY